MGDERALINAPCGKTEWDEHLQRDVTRYPAVGCNNACDRCGWNPAVAEERRRKMGYGKEVDHGNK